MAYSYKWGRDVAEAIGEKSQRSVAGKVGVSQTMIGNMVSGKIPSDMGTVRRFAEAVGQDPDEWELKAVLCETEAYLRDLYDLSDEEMQSILRILETRGVRRGKHRYAPRQPTMLKAAEEKARYDTGKE
ncbi:MAG: helix-turn-helix domain-containing protein [Armatimonadota bacterium]